MDPLSPELIRSAEPIRVEVPKRNDRLRYRRQGPAPPPFRRTRDRATLAVAEFSDIGSRPECGWLPRVLTRDLIVALGPFHRVAVSGPVPQAAVANLLAGHARLDADVVLVGDVRCDSADVRIGIRLLDGAMGKQIWAHGFPSPQTADCGLPPEGQRDLEGIAAEVADETGVIACRLMQVIATKPPEWLSVHESVLAAWRFLMTGSGDDLLRAHAATTAVVRAMPDSPAALLHGSMMRAYEIPINQPAHPPRYRGPAGPILAIPRTGWFYDVYSTGGHGRERRFTFEATKST